jgi:peptidoglycan/LPS O-acetylase OafA/YrhL
MRLRGRELSNPRFQIDALDGLRGIAVLLVFLSHTSNQGFYLFPFLNLAGIGKEGVFLFFVLSAFLLTLPFLDNSKQAFQKDALINYFVRRFFRIYPLYIFFLLFCFITGVYFWQMAGLPEPLGIPYLLTSQQVYNHILLSEGVGVSWSILVEFRFYFVLPFVAFLYAVILKNNIFLSLAATAVLIIGSQLLWPNDALTYYSILLPYIGIFFMGCGLASLHLFSNRSAFMQQRHIRIMVDSVGVLAVLVLIYLIPSVTNAITGRNVPLDYYHREYLLFGGLWSVIVFACLQGYGLFRWIFERSVLRYLGFISFSLYFFHTTSVALFKYFLPDIPFVTWWMLLFGIAISHITWICIEKPSSKIRFAR